MSSSILAPVATTLRAALLCLVALGAFVFPIPARAESESSAPTTTLPVPQGVAYHPELTYGKVGEMNLKLDLASPTKGNGPFPAVVVLHGGGWFGGNRCFALPITFELAAHGYVAVTVGYRLAPENPYPAQIEDAKCAVRWLRANADRYRIDPKRIGALGYSSGGHLALLLGSTTAPELEGMGGQADQSSRVNAIVACYPPIDLAALYQFALNGNHPPLKRRIGLISLTGLLGGTPNEKAERYAAASPLTYLKRECPPTLLIHGTADTVVPTEQSKWYESKAAKLGAPVRLLCFENAPHAFGSGLGGEFGHKGDAATVAFFDEQLKPTVGMFGMK